MRALALLASGLTIAAWLAGPWRPTRIASAGDSAATAAPAATTAGAAANTLPAAARPTTQESAVAPGPVAPRGPARRSATALPRPSRVRTATPAGGLPSAAIDASGCGAREGVLAHGPRREPVVAVTFDACPTTHSPGFAPEIVDLLERERVPTTFFVSGRWAETHPAEFARLRSVPFFEIALHGHRHRHLVHGSPDAMLAEIADGRDALRKLGATVVPVFRPPFGDSPPELAEVARRAGVVAVTWDVAPGDPDPQVGPASIERGVTSRSEAGSIVVLHVNGRGVGTPKALPGVLAGLRARGFRLARASEVLAPCAGSPVGTVSAGATGGANEGPAAASDAPSPGAPPEAIAPSPDPARSPASNPTTAP